MCSASEAGSVLCGLTLFGRLVLAWNNRFVFPVRPEDEVGHLGGHEVADLLMSQTNVDQNVFRARRFVMTYQTSLDRVRAVEFLLQKQKRKNVVKASIQAKIRTDS